MGRPARERWFPRSVAASDRIASASDPAEHPPFALSVVAQMAAAPQTDAERMYLRAQALAQAKAEEEARRAAEPVRLSAVGRMREKQEEEARAEAERLATLSPEQLKAEQNTKTVQLASRGIFGAIALGAIVVLGPVVSGLLS